MPRVLPPPLLHSLVLSSRCRAPPVAFHQGHVSATYDSTWAASPNRYLRGGERGRGGGKGCARTCVCVRACLCVCVCARVCVSKRESEGKAQGGMAFRCVCAHAAWAGPLVPPGSHPRALHTHWRGGGATAQPAWDATYPVMAFAASAAANPPPPTPPHRRHRSLPLPRPARFLPCAPHPHPPSLGWYRTYNAPAPPHTPPHTHLKSTGM